MKLKQDREEERARQARISENIEAAPAELKLKQAREEERARQAKIERERERQWEARRKEEAKAKLERRAKARKREEEERQARLERERQGEARRRKEAERNKRLNAKLKALIGVDPGKFHAVVIGNNDYPALPKLKTAVRDAKAVASVLREKYGFSVSLLLNASRVQIIDSLDKYRRTLRENDNLPRIAQMDY